MQRSQGRNVSGGRGTPANLSVWSRVNKRKKKKNPGDSIRREQTAPGPWQPLERPVIVFFAGACPSAPSAVSSLFLSVLGRRCPFSFSSAFATVSAQSPTPFLEAAG